MLQWKPVFSKNEFLLVWIPVWLLEFTYVGWVWFKGLESSFLTSRLILGVYFQKILNENVNLQLFF